MAKKVGLTAQMHALLKQHWAMTKILAGGGHEGTNPCLPPSENLAILQQVAIETVVAMKAISHPAAAYRP